MTLITFPVACVVLGALMFFFLGGTPNREKASTLGKVIFMCGLLALAFLLATHPVAELLR